jgi:hypothetical protein
MKRALATVAVGALLWACVVETPDIAPIPTSGDRDAEAEESGAGPNDGGTGTVADGKSPDDNEGGSGTSSFLPGEYETEGQARCDIMETTLSLDPLTLDPFGANGPVVFTVDNGSSNVASASDLIIVGNPDVTCTITQSGETLTVHCTHPTQGTCTEVLERHD